MKHYTYATLTCNGGVRTKTEISEDLLKNLFNTSTATTFNFNKKMYPLRSHAFYSKRGRYSEKGVNNKWQQDSTCMQMTLAVTAMLNNAQGKLL